MNITVLEKFINSEYRDAVLFRNLAAMAKTRQEKSYLERFATEETRHVEMFQEIYVQMAHRPFVPRIAPVKVNERDFYKILIEQIGNESEDYRKYAYEANRQDNSFLKTVLNEVKADENTHAHKLTELVSMHFHSGAEHKEENYREIMLNSLSNKNCDVAGMYTQMQSAWEQHVWWTRSLIVSIANSLADRNAVTARLLQNPADIASVYYQFYGKDVGAAVENLITEHLKIGGDIMQAAKDGMTDKVAALEKQWYRNADDIVSALTKINPFYDKMTLQNMFYDHLKMTTDEVVQYFSGNYEESIMTFDNIEKEALIMGNYMVDGIVKQFCK